MRKKNAGRGRRPATGRASLPIIGGRRKTRRRSLPNYSAAPGVRSRPNTLEGTRADDALGPILFCALRRFEARATPCIAIVATAGNDAKRAWLREFGATFVCDALDGLTDAVVRSIRRVIRLAIAAAAAAFVWSG